MASIYEGEIPQPLQNIGCQDLLMTENTYSGWLRKRHFVNKYSIFNWPQVYVILSKGCIYYFKNEYSKTALGKFSFYGYNSVMRSKAVAPKLGPWAFQVVHTHKEFKTYYFAAPSEREMKEWMKHVKGTLVDANGKSAEYYTYRRAAKESKDKLLDDESTTYNEIETNIYGDTPSFTVDKDYKKKYRIKMNDEASDEEDEEQPSRPPDLPPPRNDRPPQPLPDQSPTTVSRSAIGSQLPNIPGSSTNTSTRGPLPATPEGPPTIPPRKDNNETRGAKAKNRGSKESKDTHTQNSRNGHEHGVYEKAKEVEPDPEPEQAQEDEGSYWDDIHYTDSNWEKASEIIKNLETDGTFLVRDGTKGKVLLVYADKGLKKYQIQQDKNDHKFFLKKDGPHADTLEELMYEYHMIKIPNCEIKLIQPYLHHPSYKNLK
ncbi:SH3 domain-binding protein 2-like [Ylistrum balloti]|uniref:SH3 domain-binding protein 2-like n=1 Tax=Ylistrum balloti TaxID=509963 RepID=UPI002905C87C|nr:SH3 domain-binding protein 2-like [Ylistrum balloti]